MDIPINNAGSLVGRSSIEEVSDEMIDQVIRVNFLTAPYTTRAALPLLKRGTNPSIVYISSIAAHSGGGNNSTLYAAMKGALISLSKGLAKEVGLGIRVNTVDPAAVPTDFLKSNISAQRLERIAGAAPLKRLGEADDTATAVVFLCGRGAS